jgi:hypothetical protein
MRLRRRGDAGLLARCADDNATELPNDLICTGWKRARRLGERGVSMGR